MEAQKPKALTVLDIISVLLVAAAAVMVFFYAPLEAVMGQVQRVFYFHIANAWVGMLGFGVAAIAGIAYLRTGNLKWDVRGVAAVEISVVFFFVAIVSGSIWARPAWNTWWIWDVRLTSAAIAELIFAAYLLLRQGIEDPERRARFGAVYTILGFISVPITFVSIRLLQTIHPVVIGGGGGGEGGFAMTPPMLQTMFFSLFTFSILFIDLYWHRVRLGNLSSKVEQLRLKLAR
ncbi:MAG: cytochrome c biogenesis protein [Anaerolineales bacterium]|jgi:heme exporter protein C